MSILKKTRGDSTRYYVVTKNNGQRVSHGGYATEQEAREALSRVIVNKADHTFHAPSHETVNDLLDRWISDKAAEKPPKGHRPKTTEFYRDTLRLYVAPIIGTMRVQHVRRRDIQEVVTAMTKGTRKPLAASSVERRYRMLQAAFEYAVGDLIVKNPCDKKVTLGGGEAREVTRPGPLHVQAILDAAVDPYRLPLTLGAMCGLRRSEVLGLRWSDVDVGASVLHIRQGLTWTKEGPRFEKPKTSNGTRDLGFGSAVAWELRRGGADQEARREQLKSGWQDHDLVVDSGDGSPMRPERLTRYFRTLVKNLGFEGMTLHGLRHAWGTVMVNDPDVALATASKMLGHASVSFTVNQYTETTVTHQAAAVAAAEEAFVAKTNRAVAEA